ncbi:MAG: hypothetical protein HYZ74_04165, partial [Elusimicrobia bacterium]|nr:hypothetical protein [Elusimicrobiota bacterium]
EGAAALERFLSAPSTTEPQVPAAAAAKPKSVETLDSYHLHRWALRAIAALSGAVFTLPQAGAALTDLIIASLADKKLVLSDYDDSLAANGDILSAAMVERFRAIDAANKHIAVISDRSGIRNPGSNQVTVFESLAPLPVALRAGKYVAGNAGGKVFRYDAQGVPQLVHEAPPMTPEQAQKARAVAEATKARLKEVNAVQNPGDGKNNPSEDMGPYGYALMLIPGSAEDTVLEVARIMDEELARQGLPLTAVPRFARNPKHSPYIKFSVVSKADSAAWIAAQLNVKAKDAVAVGDSMYAPRPPKRWAWLLKWGAKLSGRALARMGNDTDANIARGLPGILALGVGGNMDPRLNGYTLDGHWAGVSGRILDAVASKPAERPAGLRHAVAPNELYALALEKIRAKAAETAPIVGTIRLLSAVHAERRVNGAWVGDEWRFFFGWGGEKGGVEYMVPARRTMVNETMMDAFEPELRGSVGAERLKNGIEAGRFDEFVRVSPDDALKNANEPVGRVTLLSEVDRSGGDPWYSVQASDGRELALVNARTGESRPGDGRSESRMGEVLLGAMGLAFALGMAAALYWAARHAPAAAQPSVLPPGYDGPIPDGNWMRLFGGAFGIGLLGTLGLAGSDRLLVSPAEHLATAQEIAARAIEGRGLAQSELVFAEASATMPTVLGSQWIYTFVYTAPDGRRGLVYIDMKRPVAGTGMDWSTSIYEAATVSQEIIPRTLAGDAARAGTLVAAEPAFVALRERHPAFGVRASVSLALDRDAPGDSELWYTFYDEGGGIGQVNARTGATRLKASPAAKVRHPGVEIAKTVLFVLAASALVLAFLAALLSWAVRPVVF